MIRQIINASTRQGRRFSIYAAIFLYLLFVYFEEDSSFDTSAREEKRVSHHVLAENKKHRETEFRFDSPKPHINIEPLGSFKTIGSYPDSYAMDLLVKREIKQLLTARKTFYAESRTLSASEVINLHNVKDDEVYPFAITNEAQLILRELAIEHRIPQECSDELSSECLVILESSQAGSMPFECQHPQNEEECENAFSRFWES